MPSRPGVDPRTPSRQEGVLPIKLMTLCHNFYKPSVSIALTSSDYKTGALLLC